MSSPDERLSRIRSALLALHKEVLGAERESLERVHGRRSEAEFLQIVTDRLRYGWLLPLSELIVRMDETVDAAAKEGTAVPADELADAVRALVAPPDESTAFGRRYLLLMQRRPEVVMAHAALTKELGR